MFYTGAPQNTARKPIHQLRIDEAKELMKENHIDIEDVVAVSYTHLDVYKRQYVIHSSLFTR